MLDPTRLTDTEAERLYYSIGMPDVAVLYARIVDVQAENDEYQEQFEKMVEAAEYDKLNKLVEHLQEHIKVASIALDELYHSIDDDKSPTKNKKRILAAIEGISLDPDSKS